MISNTPPNNSFNRSGISLFFIRKTWMLGQMFPARLIRALDTLRLVNALGETDGVSSVAPDMLALISGRCAPRSSSMAEGVDIRDSL